jgi:hypothetical protein
MSSHSTGPADYLYSTAGKRKRDPAGVKCSGPASLEARFRRNPCVRSPDRLEPWFAKHNGPPFRANRWWFIRLTTESHQPRLPLDVR